MVIKKRRLFIILFLACSLLSSCMPAQPVVKSATPEPQVTASPSSSSQKTFIVDAWVDNPTPSRNDKVILLGTLTMNGLYLGGIMMTATWPDKTQSRGTPNCYVMVLYQRGVCVIDASKFPAGEFVPIHISFEYRGQQFSGDTGFTPR